MKIDFSNIHDHTIPLKEFYLKWRFTDVDGTCIGIIRVQNKQATQITLGQRVGVRLRSHSDTVYYLSVCEVQKDPFNDESVQAIIRMPPTIVCGTTLQFEIVVESETIFQEFFFHLQ